MRCTGAVVPHFPSHRKKQSILPIRDGFELFYYDGEQIQRDVVDAKLESCDESNNNEDEDPATTTGDNEKKPKKQLLKNH